MILIGATVRWRHKIDKRATVIGVVTGHPQPRMVEVDGKGWISEGLLEVVGEMTDQEERMLIEVVAERDALRELVVSQATTNAELAQKVWDLEEGGDPDESLKAKIEELQEDAAHVRHCVEDMLLLFMGDRRPVRPIEPPELRRLAEFVFEGA